MSPNPDPRSNIPSVERVLQFLDTLPGMSQKPHTTKVAAVRSILQRIRRGEVDAIPVESSELVQMAYALVQAEQRSGLRRVVNGTGIILHTGLGRAVLSSEAIEAVSGLKGCCNLQIDLETGARGRRDGEIERLLQQITGCEAATLVNNNAAATLLVLSALCEGGEVIVSRGQLIEIGGSFRLPDIIRQSGARMIEVGTTNKTHLRDYESAITENTRMLLHVHTSNYRIIGFTQEVSVRELAPLARKKNLILVEDLGCGALVDLARFNLPHEPTVQESLEAGADVALFSGDKLIGGPQAGILVGRKDYIARIRKHPLTRALRVGKFTVAALEATLRLFLNPEKVWQSCPTLRMLSTPLDELHRRASALSERLRAYVDCVVVSGKSACGGGALPQVTLDTVVLQLRHRDFSSTELARRLRTEEPSVIPYVHQDMVHLDVRTLLEGDEELIIAAVRNLKEQ